MLLQVSQHNEQAEPRENVSNYSQSRIHARPPIRGVQTPPNPVIGKSIPKTPSRIPIPKTPTRASKINNGTVTTVNIPNVMDEFTQPTIAQMPSPNRQTGNTFVVITSPSRQSDKSAAVPATIAPTPSNMTINVNINKSKSQPSNEIVQEVNAHAKRLKGIEGNAKTGYLPNSSSDSLMTNDDSSDSGENRTDTSGYLNTPLATRKSGASDVLNTSARRQLFTKSSNDQHVQGNTTTIDQSPSSAVHQMASQNQSSPNGRTFDVITSPSRKSIRRPTEPATDIPASSNNTINANVNNSMPQSPQEVVRNLNPVVVLSPLYMENIPKNTRAPSLLPLDLVLTPPTNFQNSCQMSWDENDDDLIVEASPTTREMRKLLLEQRKFEEVCSIYQFFSRLICVH